LRYNNYHKHDDYSNIRTPDVVVKQQDYINRIKELEHTHYFTTNHGCSGNVFEAYDLCKKNNVKLVYGMEMYYVDNRFLQEDRTNYHIIVVGLTKNAYKAINKISSQANTSGFYYKPRIDMELLLALPKDEVIITTACIAGRLFKTDDYEEKFVLPLKEYFGNNFLLEVQSHSDIHQAQYNKQILELSKKYNIGIIHANDSHYIYPEQAEDRVKFLKGKNMNYEDEDSFILDYPDSYTIFERYETQGVLTKEQVKQALENTLVFDKAEDLNFDKKIKMPSIYPNQDKNKILKSIIDKKWKEEAKNINEDKIPIYQEAINFEIDIVEKTNMADYFLLNEKIINKAINEYGAVLTKTGRGSSPSYYINKLLGFTDIDRIDAEVPLYATRFMSTARILESGSLPDIDFNFADVKPVIKASKDILGEDHVYYMVAYGTMKESAAFRNLCRAYGLEMDEYNEIAKDLEKYQNDEKWKDLINESKKYIGVIDSISPSPCSFVLLDKSISEELGLIKVGEEICACIDGYTSDVWKFLKNDYLVVSVWDLISETFKLINEPIPSIKELKSMLDEKVWKLYQDGITATLNQADSDFATSLIKKYSPKSVAEMSAFVAAIRPGFSSLLNHFLNRENYTTGIEELDKVLEDSFHYLLYQESIMKFLMWCGIKEDQTYDIIKKIAKKKFKQNELDELKNQLVEGFKRNTGNENGFNEVWQVVEDAAHYSFNASHSLSVAYDSLYGAYLKANYPLEYYTVILNHYKNDTDKTKKIISELKYFNIEIKPIKFRYSGANYKFDKETNAIYQGIASLKYLNELVGEELYRLKDNKYDTFYDLLIDLKNKTSINSRQLKILVSTNFFNEFGKNKKLLQFIDYFDILFDCKQMKKEKIDKLNIQNELFIHDLFEKNSNQTEKMYKDINYKSILQELWSSIENKQLSLREQIKAELEYLNYILFTESRAGKDFYVVTEFKTYQNQCKPYLTLYQLKTGDILKTKIKDEKEFSQNPLKLFDLIKIEEFKTERKNKKVDGKWVKSEETEEILAKWQVI
jgi:DNA polymerase III alpha subunit